MPASTSIHPDLISCSSEERSEPPGRAQRSETAERREVLLGLPGGPGVDEQPLEISDEVLDALLRARAWRRRSRVQTGCWGTSRAGC